MFVDWPKKDSTDVDLDNNVEVRIEPTNVALSILRFTISVRTSVKEVV